MLGLQQAGAFGKGPAGVLATVNAMVLDPADRARHLPAVEHAYRNWREYNRALPAWRKIVPSIELPPWSHWLLRVACLKASDEARRTVRPLTQIVEREIRSRYGTNPQFELSAAIIAIVQSQGMMAEAPSGVVTEAPSDRMAEAPSGVVTEAPSDRMAEAPSDPMTEAPPGLAAEPPPDLAAEPPRGPRGRTALGIAVLLLLAALPFSMIFGGTAVAVLVAGYFVLFLACYNWIIAP
jgi:hypothetical protein